MISLLAFLQFSASAADFNGGVAATGWAPRADAETAPAAGLSGEFGVAATQSVDIELRGGAGYGTSFRGVAGPELRLHTAQFDEHGGLSAVLGTAAVWRDGLAPVANAGIAFDFHGARRPRAAVLVEWGDREVSALTLSLGYVWRAKTPSVVVEVTPDPVVVVPPEVVVEPAVEDPLVWVPHPVCAWVPTSEVAPLLASLGITTPLALPAPVDEPAMSAEGFPNAGVAVPAAAPGAVIVMAHPGDAVTIADAHLPVADDGVVVTKAPEGPIDVVVSGGGRSQTLSGEVSSGHALWLRADAPSRTDIQFDAGQSAITPESLTQLQTVAANAGTWKFTVQGGYSADGDLTRNQALAETRAQSVFAALIAAGLPADRVQIIPSQAPDLALTPAAQRATHIVPVPEGK